MLRPTNISMPHFDLIIRNGTLVTPAAVFLTDLAIADEQIVAIEPELAGFAREIIDAQGFHIFPGLIDAHVHFNEPGRDHWEGWATGSAALAAGGGTLCFDMPLNSSPPTCDAASFAAKRAAAERSSLVDFALWGGLTPTSLAHIDELAALGVVGFKAFMSNSGLAEFPAADDMTLYDGMLRCARLGKLVAVHAENDSLTAGLAARAQADGRISARDFLASRPAIAELEAIQRAIMLAEATGCRLHIVHVSLGRGVAMVAEAAARGVDVSCETCPHYLVLSEDDLERLGPVAKCAPPLRPAAETEALWGHLAAGTITLVASDHSPSPPDMKGYNPSLAIPQSLNYFALWGGISGVQTTLPLLLSEGYHRRQLPLQRIAALCTTNVAQRFALPTHKGQIAIGAHADLAMVELDAAYQLSATDLHYRYPLSPFLAMPLRGRIIRTLRRGHTIYPHPPTAGGKLVNRE
jgi:allantoinase